MKALYLAKLHKHFAIAATKLLQLFCELVPELAHERSRLARQRTIELSIGVSVTNQLADHVSIELTHT